MPIIVIMAYPNASFPIEEAETNTDPTNATPMEDPKFETLRERPDISPWSFSGKLDWTTFTEEVSMMPIPPPIRNSPGAKYRI